MRRFVLEIVFRLTGLAGLIALLFAVVTGIGRQQFKRTSISAFTHVAVIDVERGRLIPDQTVIINGGRITSLGASRNVSVPAGATVINGTGRFLVPGFADMHVHLYTEGDVFTYLANGITTVRNMAGDASHLAFKKRTASGEMIGPRIVTAGPVIETKLSHPDNALVRTAADARREVARQHVAGYDFIKVYNDITLETYLAVIEAARSLKMSVAGHVPYSVGLGGALRARQKSIEHLRGYPHELMPESKRLVERPDFREFTLAWNNIDLAEIDRLARETVTAGAWNCPTLTFTVHEMSPEKTHRQLVSRPETRWLSLTGLPSDRTKGYLAEFTDADFVAAQRGLENQFRLVRALEKAGAGLIVGTDSWLSGYAFADEMDLLVRAGLSPARVLRMATLDAARFMNEEKTHGSIATGKSADVVLLDANPLDDVGNSRKIRGVMHNGRYYDRIKIDEMIARLRERKEKK